MSSKPVLLSGVKPTGKIHIGNYFGAMKQFVDLQDQYESFIFIADIHALNRLQNLKAREDVRGEQLQNTYEIVLAYLAIGLDSKKTTIYKQSDVMAHTYLGWIFNAMTSMPYLMRAHAFKDAEAKNKEISVGTFVYPMLMAADILLYDADVVPVGKDQKQHIEFARDAAQKFNAIFGETFKLPKEIILDDTMIVPGLDGQKMSKSYDNTIPLFATAEETEALIKSAPMDSKGVDEKKNPDDYPIYKIYKLVASAEEDAAMRKMFEDGGTGYAEMKDVIAKKINEYFAPIRARREELLKDPDYVKEILREGGAKALEIANKKIEVIKDRIGLTL